MRTSDWHNRAFIDLGSNSLRMLVVRIYSDQTVSEVTHLKQMVRLGEGAFETGKLQPKAMRRVIDALREFGARCREFGVTAHNACATASVRAATNGPEFMLEIERHTGFAFNVISGEEEARLIGLGVSTYLPEKTGRLILDIGGGSTELILMQGRELIDAVSVNVGAVRVADHFIKDSGPVSAETYEAMKTFVRGRAEDAFVKVRKCGPLEMIATSGTAKCLARMEAARTNPNGKKDLQVTLKELHNLAGDLCRIDETARCALPGMNPRRSSILIPGAAILETMMEGSGFSELKYSERTLRDGMLIDYLNRLKG